MQTHANPIERFVTLARAHTQPELPNLCALVLRNTNNFRDIVAHTHTHISIIVAADAAAAAASATQRASRERVCVCVRVRLVRPI